MRVSQGFWGTREHWQNIEGNKGTLANFLGTGEQNSKNYSTKTFEESVGTWEHRAILEGNKGTRTPPLGDPQTCCKKLFIEYVDKMLRTTLNVKNTRTGFNRTLIRLLSLVTLTGGESVEED